MKTLGLVIVAASVCLSRDPASAALGARGLVLEQRIRHSFRSMAGMVTQDDTTTVYLSPAGVRIGAAGGSRASKFCTIFRFEPKTRAASGPSSGAARRGRVLRIEVNGFRRTYKEEDLSERAARNEAVKKVLEERLKKMRGGDRGGPGGPGGMLGGLAGLMGGAGARPQESSSPVVTRKTGDVKSVAGSRCRRVEFLQDGKKVFEGWYTEGPAPAWVRRFDLEEYPGANNSALMRARKAQGGLELGGFFYLPAGGRHEVVTTRITEKPIPASTFQPPRGYRKVTPGAPGK